jgi:hypothetical protein
MPRNKCPDCGEAVTALSPPVSAKGNSDKAAGFNDRRAGAYFSFITHVPFQSRGGGLAAMIWQRSM